ncbi:MAG: hypothetical protein FJ317_09530 [SAR202 cluster bacterium]|nr:hypothetical protein [SAR202 cluster bacterium]
MAKSTGMKGKVQTVLGAIEPEELGYTLMHEHILIDAGCYFAMPEEATGRHYIGLPMAMDMLGQIGRYWGSNRDNTKMYDVADATREVLEFRYAGGGTIVDTTSVGLARDPLAMARISRATGLNIVMGSSYYIDLAHPPDMDKRTEDQIAREIIRDVTAGVGDTGIRSGIIGEVGQVWPPNKNAEKVLRASVSAQKETGAPMTIHPGFNSESTSHIMKLLRKLGADMKHTVMGHLDDIRNDRVELKELADSGLTLEFDTFNNEDSSFGNAGDQVVHIPNDVQRMERVEYLIDAGYEDQVVIAQDIFLKSQMTKYGGKGYGHIMNNIVPRMRKRGFTETQIRKLLVDNPARVLAFR